MLTVFSFCFVRFDDETGGSNNEKERFARYGFKSGEQDVIGDCLCDSIKTAIAPTLFPTVLLSFCFFLVLLCVLHFSFFISVVTFGPVF